MGPTERVLYAVPIVLRRLLRRAEPDLRRQAWELIKASFERASATSARSSACTSARRWR